MLFDLHAPAIHRYIARRLDTGEADDLVAQKIKTADACAVMTGGGIMMQTKGTTNSCKASWISPSADFSGPRCTRRCAASTASSSFREQ